MTALAPTISQDRFAQVLGSQRGAERPPAPEGDDALYHTRNDEGERYERYPGGPLHRDDGPALITVGVDGERREGYYQDGELLREVAFRADGSHEESFYRDGVLHRDDAPAYIRIDPRHDDRVEQWHRNGKLHREGAPATTYVSPSSNREVWYLNGLRHREDGPAEVVETTVMGALTAHRRIERWYRHGEQHRTDGPAETYTHRNGRREHVWHRNDEKVPPPRKERLLAWLSGREAGWS